MQAELKVPQGKLVRVKFDVAENLIRNIKFTGDFFLHPEDDLEKLESALEGKPADEEALKDAVLGFFKDSGSILVGAKPESFLTVILAALESKV
ncbi:MAG: lipoate protein ligase C-terminal domain-containing protein [Candidatus Bathyarchaeia archaeon]